MAKFEWLTATHTVYDEWRDEWLRNERRLRGGGDVIAELRPFIWEKRGGVHYRERQAEAVYVNWPEQFAVIMTGHLLREAPTPDGGGLDFGTLGEVARTGLDPSYAELVYHNVDGAGQDGSEWDAWWMAAEKRAMATGHRWLFVEGAPFAPSNLDDVLYRGARPYLVEFSPLSVPWWHFDHGRLVAAIVRVSMDQPRLADDGSSITGIGDAGYMLLTADGFTGFGDDFAGGGWWLFDSERVPMFDGDPSAAARAGAGSDGASDSAGRRRFAGDWTYTRGEIPMFPLFWERDQSINPAPSNVTVDSSGSRVPDHLQPGQVRPALSRPALTELGQLAVSEMNLESAADYDAWDAGSSVTFFVGVTKDAFNLADEKRGEGSKWVPLLAGEDGSMPEIHEGSAGAVESDVFEKRVASKREAAASLAAMAASSTPDSSGRSKEMGFAESKSPRLALAAKHLQQAQNAAIRFLEMRFGNTEPRGSTVWPKEFDLRNVIQDIADLFGIENESGLHSATLGAKLMVTAARDKGFLASDEEAETVEEEYKDAAERRDTQASQAGAAFAQFGSTP